MTDSDIEQEDHPEFTIVGIGASAGGLAALKTFFGQVPEDSGLAFVIVVHLAPDQESHLANLLQPSVKMPVQQVTETMPLEPNQVYVIPPNANLNTIDTHLRLSDLEQRRQERAPIDHFFRTLAATHDGHSVGVILTGTGSDGTLGIKEIKGQGGLVIAQDPNEAEYDGMPQSAIASGSVDLVLPLEKIPPAIIRFSQTIPQMKLPKGDSELEDSERQLLHKIFAQMRAHTFRDFSHYKRSTIMRRIARRMQLCHVEELTAYLKLLREKPEEVRALAEDLLITVTNFFRNPEVFEQLEREVVPKLFSRKQANESLRVWSVGCATGEEAYSLAILLLETATRMNRETSDQPLSIQIFASDLHERSLERAREGFYPGDIETDVSPERLRRFFQKENGGYRIRKEVREMVVFAPHNLLGDPPFSRLDLVACRNLLIYLQRDVQHDVVELFHYALQPEGYLLLGASETIESSDLFLTEDKKLSLYRKRNVPAPEPRLPVFPPAHTRIPRELGQLQQENEPVAYGVLHQRLVERYAPPSLLVSSDDKVVHLSEHAGRYLEHPGGEMTANVFKLVRKELRIELRAALHASRDQDNTRRSKPIPVRFNGDTSEVVLHVRPSPDPQQRGFALVIFEERDILPPSTEPPSQQKESTASEEHSQIQEMEAELNITKQRLQAIIEEYETSQEEMKASNEEMQSTNEELRSTMEELETSKEELQSMNEELSTVNQENRHKVEELAQLSGDLQNLLKATDIATLFLDRQLRILRFTPQVGELFNVRMTDRGRPLSDLTTRLVDGNIMRNAQRVLDKLAPIINEMRDDQDRWYLARILPYRSTDDRIEGVVITFVDITDRKHAEQEVEQARKQAEQILASVPEPLLVLMPNLSVENANQTFYDEFKVAKENTLGQKIYELGNGQWNIPALRNLLEKVLPKDDRFYNYEMQHNFEQIGPRTMLLSGRRLEKMQRILVSIKDITELRRAQEQVTQRDEHLRLIMVSATDFAIFTLDLERKITDWNVGAERMMGYSKEEIIGQLGDMVYTPEERNTQPEAEMKTAAETGRAFNECWHVRKDGSRFWGSGTMMPLRENDELRGFLKIMTDDTERRQMEEELRLAKNEAEHAAQAKADFLAHMSHEIRTPLNAILGIANLLLEKNSLPDQLENLQTLRFSADNLRALVNDILDFSKIQAGKVAIEETNLNLPTLLKSLEKAHEPMAQEKGNKLRFQLDEQIPTVVRTDALKLSQILNNLVSNALKFTHEGRVTVDVSLPQQVQNDYHVTFSVQDTGIGIPADKLEAVFETFTQADISTVRQYGGTGLGLSITKLLLEIMGSQIKVESEVGKGSRFFFTLRLREGTADTVTDENLEVQSDDPAGVSNARVLLVEDAPINRTVLIQFLREWWNFVPDIAGNGQEAVEKAQQTQYDLILMDIRMPVMDGYQAARAIRELPGYAHTPLLALTADTPDEVRSHPEASLFQDVITKPFDPQELRQKVLQFARGRGSAPSSPKSKKASVDEAAPNGLNLQRVREIFLDEESVRQFLENAITELTKLQAQYSQAIVDRNAAALGDMAHRMKMLLDMLNLNNVQDLLEQSRNTVEGSVDEEALQEVQSQTEARLEEACQLLRQYLEDKEEG